MTGEGQKPLVETRMRLDGEATMARPRSGARNTGAPMTQREDLLSLADRCERATEPDRELDASACKALGNKVLYDASDPNDREPYWEAVKGYSWQVVPTYTASLDAAMTLVPANSLWAAGDDVEGPFARLCIPIGLGYVGGEQPAVYAATPALALCAAALRSQASLKENQ